MAVRSRKNLRRVKRSTRSKRSKRSFSRRQRGGGTVDVYFKTDSASGNISNVYSADPTLTVTPAAVGKVNIVSKDSTKRLTGIAIHGMKGASATWPADSALMQATGYTGTKLVLAKGTSSLTSTTGTGFKFNSGGTAVSGANLNIAGIYGTGTWGTQNPDPTGAPPPGAPAGTPNVNTRMRFTVV